MTLELGDEREQEGELTGKRWPGEHREEEDNELRAKLPLFARGRTAACVGEEADGGGEGSRGTVTMSRSQGTCSRARRRRVGSGRSRNGALDAATAHRARA